MARPKRIAAREVADILDRLTAKSLVQFSPSEGRYSLSESMRGFLREDLSAMQTKDLRRTAAGHARYFTELADHRAHPPCLPLREIENARGALDECWRSQELLPTGLLLTIRLYETWYRAGLFNEGRDRAMQALVMSAGQQTHDVGRVLWVLGDLAIQQGDYAGAETALNRMLDLAMALDDQDVEVRARAALASVAMNQADFDVAHQRFTRVAKMYESAGDTQNFAVIMVNLAELVLLRDAPHAQGAADPETLAECDRYLEQAIEAAKDAPDSRGSQWIQTVLARRYLASGDVAAAREILLAAYQKAVEQDFQILVLRVLNDFALLALHAKQLESAARFAGRAEQSRSDISFYLPPSERPRWAWLEQTLAAELGEDYEKLKAEGRHMGVDDMVAAEREALSVER